MRYLLFPCLLLIFSACSQKKGCTNELASNFDNDADINCCCEFAVQEAIDEIVGSYEIKETCSGSDEVYSVNIKRSPTSTESIQIENFNNMSHSVEAIWDEGEFDLQNIKVDDCTMTITGSVHKASGKLFFIYALFPNASCQESGGKTCEARSF